MSAAVPPAPGKRRPPDLSPAMEGKPASGKKIMLARDALTVALALAFVLYLHGAVPFLALPTLGQAVWTTGFSQSFVNESIFNIYARNFGGPEPAAIAFGLAGAWPAGLLIRAGLHPADAYSAMAAFWLAVGFFSAWRIGRLLGLPRTLAMLAAVLWMSMPVVRVHAGYSMVGLGIGLLPFYFLAALTLFSRHARSSAPRPVHCAFHVAAAVIAVFMDGYSFMMFAAGSTLLWAYLLVTRAEPARNLIGICLPVHALGLGLAYFLYTAYLGHAEFSREPMDFFRGWGLDLAFIAIPTQGQHWLFDILGLSVQRSEERYFGDPSVWTSSFSLPILAAGLVGWRRMRHRSALASGLLLLALAGLYMALGPSLKINATKPEPAPQVRLMPAESAIMPTGNAWISAHLPGFSAMRASYRWAALGIFGCWALAALLAAGIAARRWRYAAVLLAGLTLLNLPHLADSWAKHTQHRRMFLAIDRELVAGLREALHPDEHVAFIPYRNDFIINYLAPRLGIRAYNIGGDKNLHAAQKHWPPALLEFNRELDGSEGDAIAGFLLDGHADAVVIPYFHTLWAAHAWPCLSMSATPPSGGAARVRSPSGPDCPRQLKERMSASIRRLEKHPYLLVNDTALFATMRLRPEFASSAGTNALRSDLLRRSGYPVRISPQQEHLRLLLQSGWHEVEATHVWSGARAELRLPMPERCHAGPCAAILRFVVFGASAQRPVTVRLRTDGRDGGWSGTVLANSEAGRQAVVPLAGGAPFRHVTIEVPAATSPSALGINPDQRTLGIALLQIGLAENPDR
jgi:hypothetical protein